MMQGSGRDGYLCSRRSRPRVNRVLIVALVLSGCLAGPQSWEPSEADVTGPACMYYACPVDDVPVKGPWKVPSRPAVLAMDLPWGIEASDAWIVWSLDGYAEHGRSMLALDRAGGRVIGQEAEGLVDWPHLHDTTVVYAAAVGPRPIYEQDMETGLGWANRPYHVQIHAWNLTANENARLDIPLDGAIYPHDFDGRWILLRQNATGMMRIHNATSDERMWIYDVQSGALIDPGIPVVGALQEGPSSNDAYLWDGRLLWEEHDEGVTTIRSFDPADGTRTVLLETSDEVAYFWKVDDGWVTTDWDTVVHRSDQVVALSAADVDVLYLGAQGSLAVWQEIDDGSDSMDIETAVSWRAADLGSDRIVHLGTTTNWGALPVWDGKDLIVVETHSGPTVDFNVIRTIAWDDALASAPP